MTFFSNTLPLYLTHCRRTSDLFVFHGAAVVASTMRAPEQSAGNLVSLQYSLACEHYSILQAGRVCRLYVWGDVRYRDAFDENRQSRFCYSTRQPRKNQYSSVSNREL
jgi:hypothetical protein